MVDYIGTGLDENGNPTLERTFSHEAGHTAGLLHPRKGEPTHLQTSPIYGLYTISKGAFKGTKTLMDHS